MKKLIIIPAYNEQESLLDLVQKIKDNCKDYDYIIINDCSTDNTYDICRENQLPVLNLPVNLGIGGCMQTGYRYAQREKYDLAVQIDGDGQHDPTQIVRLEQIMGETGADIVIGSRFIEKRGFQSSLARRVGIHYFRNLIKLLTKKEITDPTSGLRLCNRLVIELFAEDYPRDYPEPETIVALLRSNFHVEETATVMNERTFGTSSIKKFGVLYYMIKVTLALLFGALCTRKIKRRRLP